MGEYTLDSLNMLYADGHFIVSSINSQGVSQQTFSPLGAPTRYATLDRRASMLEGSVEGNLIYRKLYADDKTPRFPLVIATHTIPISDITI